MGIVHERNHTGTEFYAFSELTTMEESKNRRFMYSNIGNIQKKVQKQDGVKI